MADIKALLRINQIGNGEIETITTNEYSNNLSLFPYSNNLLPFIIELTEANKNYGGAKGTPIGITTINDLRFGVVDDNNVRSLSYKGVDLGYTDSNGDKTIRITIVGQDIIKFKIYFDEFRNNYPVNYSITDIDNVRTDYYNNTENYIEVTQRAGYGTTIIEITKWALPNTSIGITFFENVEINMKLNKQWIENFTTQTQKTSDSSTVQYGVLANTGNILLKDINNELYNKAKLGYLDMYVFSLELYINNNLIQQHTASQSPFYSSNSTLNLQLTNTLSYWNKIDVEKKVYYSNTTLYNVLVYVLSFVTPQYTTTDIDDMLNINIIDTDTDDNYYIRTLKYKFENIIIPPFTLNKGKIIDQLNKICLIAECQCYLDDKNKLKFVSARPLHNNLTELQNKAETIVIPFKYQTKKLEYDMLVSNRYEDVEIS